MSDGTSHVVKDDNVKLPVNFKDMPTVIVTWAQDGVSRKAIYHVGYGEVTRTQKDILVFIAVELLSESYIFKKDHLARKWTSFTDPTAPPAPIDDKSKIPTQSGSNLRNPTGGAQSGASNPSPPETAREAAKEVKIDSTWQYGKVSSSEQFLVYHSLRGRVIPLLPSQDRFITAMIQSPYALNPYISDHKSSTNTSGVSYTRATGIDTYDKSWGKALVTF